LARLWRWGPGIVLDVEAHHLAISKMEDVTRGSVLQPMRLALAWFAIKGTNALANLATIAPFEVR